jgi:hypothetical protein
MEEEEEEEEKKQEEEEKKKEYDSCMFISKMQPLMLLPAKLLKQHIIFSSV